MYCIICASAKIRHSKDKAPNTASIGIETTVTGERGAHRFSSGAISGAGAVTGARVTLLAASNVGVGGVGHSAHEHLSVGVLAAASHERVSDGLGVDAGEGRGKAVGPGAGGGALVALDADLDLSARVHVCLLYTSPSPRD